MPADTDTIDQEDIRQHKIKVLLQEPKALAKQRLMDFAESLNGARDEDSYHGDPDVDWDERLDVDFDFYPDVTYEELLARAQAFQESGDYWHEGPRFEGQNIYPQFWADYQLVTNLPVNETYPFFSCSC